MRSIHVLVLAAAILASGAGFIAYRMTAPDQSLINAAAELMRLKLRDTSGMDQPLAQWSDKVLIVNFWATWCEPCRKEVPALVRTQTKHASNGVQIVGISIDNVDKVRQFALEYGVKYPLLIGSMDVIDLTRGFGNKAGGLPYTVILDRAGNVVATRLGGISEAELEKAIRRANS